MERMSVESLRAKLRGTRLATTLDLIEEAAQAIWAPDAPRIVRGFTDHGTEHSCRVAGWAGELLNARTPWCQPPSADELFLLLAGSYLHDIGMQADVKFHPDIREAAEGLGAEFDTVFDSSVRDFSPQEQGAVRKNHQYLSAAWIQLAAQSARRHGGGRGTKLEAAMGHVDDRLIQDLMDVCMFHSTLDIATCGATGKRDHRIRLRMTAALLRLADELDVNSWRVDIDTVENFGMSPDNALYWHLHKRTDINLIGTGIRITVALHPEDIPLVEDAIQDSYINKFVRKNMRVLEVLQESSIPLSIDTYSGISENGIAERLPEDIVSALNTGTRRGSAKAGTTVREYLEDFNPPLGSHHFGRQDLLDALQEDVKALAGSVVCVHAAAGEGKSALFFRLLSILAASHNPYAGASVVLHWRFASASRYVNVGQSVSDFLDRALTTLGVHPSSGESDDFARASLLLDLINRHKPLLILDGFDELLDPEAHSIANPVMRRLIRTIAGRGLRQGGLVLLGSTQRVSDLDYFAHGRNISLPSLTEDDCVALLRSLGVNGSEAQLRAIASLHDRYPLALALLGKEMERGRLTAADILGRARALPRSRRLDAVYGYYDAAYPEGSVERTALYVLASFRGPASWPEIQRVLAAAALPGIPSIGSTEWNEICASLEGRGFILRKEASSWLSALSPRVLREHTADVFQARHRAAFRSCNLTLASMSGEKYVPDDNPTLPALEPLYDQVFYLCRAGEYANALDCYWERLCRRREFYTQKMLGAFSKDLQLVSLFFHGDSWTLRDDLDLDDSRRAWLLAVTAYLLNAMGALPESEELREREVQLHEELGNSRLAAQDRMLMATTQIFQCKMLPALRNLERAQDLLAAEATGESADGGQYSGLIDSAVLGNNIQVRRVLADYFTAPFEIARGKAVDLDLSSLDTSSGFFAFLVLLDGLGRHPNYSASAEDLDRWTSLIASYCRRGLAAGRSYQAAYGEALQAVLAWRAQEGGTEVLKHLTAARQAMARSGRLDVAPMIHLLSLQLCVAFEEEGSALVSAARRGVWEEELKESLAIHQADLYQIEYSILRIRSLMQSGQDGEARARIEQLVADHRTLVHGRVMDFLRPDRQPEV